MLTRYCTDAEPRCRASDTIVELETERSGHCVKFSLFGKFKIVVNGQEVVFPEAAFSTYLKLSLLSGDHFFDCIRASRKDITASMIRNILDKGNIEPRFGQGGRFDFANITGLSLRYREGYGIELQGSGWQCDLHEFEEIWAQRENVSDDALRLALALYGSGIDIRSWKRDPILIKCLEWIKRRLGVLQEHQEDIKAELKRRLESKQAETKDGDLTQEDGDARKWSDNANCHETSGLTEPDSNFDSTAQSSAILGGDLCENMQDDAVHVRPDAVGVDDILGERQSELDSAAGAETVKVHVEPTHVENSSKSETESSEPRRVFLPIAEPRRTVTGTGVAFVAFAAFSLLLLGYLLGRIGASDPTTISTAKNVASRPIGVSDRPNTSGSTPSDARNNPSIDQDYKEPPPENPVMLSSLFLSDAAGNGIVTEVDDVVIGHQIFTGYIRSNSVGYSETSPVFKLDRGFRTIKCVLGAPDPDAWTLYAPAREVVFWGDGRVLKKVRISAGKPVSVEVSVREVNAFVITFMRPVVIVSAKAWR